MCDRELVQLKPEHAEKLQQLFSEVRSYVPDLSEIIVFGNNRHEMLFHYIIRQDTEEDVEEEERQYFAAERNGEFIAISMNRDDLSVYGDRHIKTVSEEQFWALFQSEYIEASI